MHIYTCMHKTMYIYICRSGEATLSFVDADDLNSKKVRIIPAAERKPVATIDDIDIDADDIQTITRTDIYSTVKRKSQRVVSFKCISPSIPYYTTRFTPLSIYTVMYTV